jgi:hypothetical protein
MSRHRYPINALLADYVRSALGVLLPIALMLFTDLLPLVSYSMTALAMLFAIYGFRTAWRQGAVITVDRDGVRQEGPLRGLLDRGIRWSELRDIQLRYYSTQRDRRKGWMQLILRSMGTHGVIRMDSQLPGFGDIVRQAHAAARDHDLIINPTTAANLLSLGVVTADPATATAVTKPKR